MNSQPMDAQNPLQREPSEPRIQIVSLKIKKKQFLGSSYPKPFLAYFILSFFYYFVRSGPDVRLAMLVYCLKIPLPSPNASTVCDNGLLFHTSQNCC